MPPDYVAPLEASEWRRVQWHDSATLPLDAADKGRRKAMGKSKAVEEEYSMIRDGGRIVGRRDVVGSQVWR